MGRNGFHSLPNHQNPNKQTVAFSKHLSRDEFVKMIAEMVGKESFNENEKLNEVELAIIAMAVFFYFKRSVVLNVRRTGRELFDDLYRQYLEGK